ncbi:MAG: tetratricopeptide repeat protein, partial [candidate division WOR-3 bacterium]|nr:tetratricopeptide repeat protein [candidate division WOR-3 bacterium]
MPKRKTIGGKYTIIKKIAETNYAQVYKVKYDNGQIVALKISRSDDPLYNKLIVHEYSTLNNVNHPNIVKVFDCDLNDDGRLYFTLEYIDGEPINKHFKEFTSDFAVAMLQVISALKTLRSRGFIHSDLKPEHILHDAKLHRTVLIDFGFTNIVGENFDRGGTLGYVSPESLRDISIDQRSDLYSFGVVLYETLSGKRFSNKSIAIEHTPKEIISVMKRLVSKEPTLRPSIHTLYESFKKFDIQKKFDCRAYHVSLPNPAFIKHPSSICDWLLHSGTPTIILYGDYGSGKTRWLQEIRFNYLQKGFRTMYFTPQENRSLLKSLNAFLGDPEEKSWQAEHKFQIFENITDHLTLASNNRRILLLIDDIDNLSDFEINLFRYIGHGVRNSSVRIIGTSRANNKIDNLGFETIKLGNWTVSDIGRMLTHTFSGSVSIAKLNTHTLSTDFSQWLHKESGGNPSLIAEILRTLFDNHIIFYDNNYWRVTTKKLQKLTLPRSVEESVASRLERLSTHEIEILKILCITGHPIKQKIINKIMGVSIREYIERIKNLNLIRDENPGKQKSLAIANRTISKVVWKLTNESERKSLSELILRTLDSVESENIEYTCILAELNEILANSKEALKYYRIAACKAEAMHDYGAALAHYKKILTHTRPNMDNAYFMYITKAAELSQIMGNTDDAVAFYESALETNVPSILAKAYGGLGKIYSAMGNYDRATNNLGKALTMTEMKSRVYIELANQMGYVLVNMSRFDEALLILKKSLNLAHNIGNKEVEADTLYYISSLKWYTGKYREGIKQTKQLTDFCKKHQLIKQYAFCASLLGAFYQQLKDVTRAQKWFTEAINAFSKMKRIDGLSAVLHNNGLLLMNQGRYEKAQELFDEVLRIVQRTNNKSVQLAALANNALINRDLGRIKESIVVYREILDIDSEYAWASYGLAEAILRTNNIEDSKSLLAKKSKLKEDILYGVGLALVSTAEDSNTEAKKFLEKTLELMVVKKPHMSIQVESYTKAGCLYFELGDYDSSLKSIMRLLDLTYEGGREHSIGRAVLKMNHYVMGKEKNIDIEQETLRLKELGCIYDYAYLKRLLVESIVTKGQVQDNVRRIVEELSAAQ